MAVAVSTNRLVSSSAKSSATLRESLLVLVAWAIRASALAPMRELV
jgi:hypothetical protein